MREHEGPPAERKETLDIRVQAGAGSGRTLLSAFDGALLAVGAADYNLVRLSSVIPAAASVRPESGPAAGAFGDRLLCVYAVGYADHPGETIWAGLGWARAADGRGLFVEHTGGSQETVAEQIRLSLDDMSASRGVELGEPEMLCISAHCDGRPVCAIVLAHYRVEAWSA